MNIPFDFMQYCEGAWLRSMKNTAEFYEKLTADLLSKSCTQLTRIYKTMHPYEPYDDEVLYAINYVAIALMRSDGVVSNGEHDAYSKFCYGVGRSPYDVSDINAELDKHGQQGLNESIALLKDIRHNHHQGVYYNDMVKGLVYLCCCGDRSFAKGEFLILMSLLDSTDVKPYTWDEFKRKANFWDLKL